MFQAHASPRLMGDQEAKASSTKHLNVIGWILAVFLIYAGIALGGSVTAFVNLPSAMFVLGVSYFVGVAAYGWRNCNYAIKALLFVYRKRIPSSLEIRHVHIIRSMRVTVVYSGLVGFLIGLVQMLRTLNDPATIGPAVAVALLTVFYGLLLVLFLFQPALSSLEDHLLKTQADTDTGESK